MKAVFNTMKPSAVERALIEQRQNDGRQKNGNLLVSWSRNSTNLTVVRTQDIAGVTRDSASSDIVQS